MSFPAVFELSSLDGTNGFVLNGIDVEEGLGGIFVSDAGDVNGDEFDDIIIGLPKADPNGSYSAGQGYVVFGSPGDFISASLNLSTLDGSNGFALNGINAGDNLGRSVSSAGDINGDGFDDIIIGASSPIPRSYSSRQIYVVFGKSGGFSANLNLSTLDGTNGFTINSINAFNDGLGVSVSSAGDVNGDGFDDIIISAPDANPNGYSSGQSYVVFGKSDGFSASFNLSTLDGTNGFALNGVNARDFSGSVSSAGDVNGDGFDDLIIGAPGADPNGDSSGQTYVVFGKSGGFSPNLNLSTLDGTNGFALNGVNLGDALGGSVSSAGDVNGDGFDDLIIGAPFTNSNNNAQSGQSYVVFGRSGGFSASFNLSTLDGTNGFAINGINVLDRSGGSLSSAGDINGDGFDDLIIGRTGYAGVLGQIYVVFGRSGGFSASFNLSTLDGTNGFALNGVIVPRYSLVQVSSAGDLNGDDLDDLIIGDQERSYVVFGRGSSLITLAVSLSSAPEDGTANLVYTFTRAGNLTNSLTVHYTIDGTATNGIDYETIGTSVTFAANSATATVTVNPIDDTEVEPNNETVALTLVAAPAYNIGTFSAVTGTIIDFANFDPAQYGASNTDLIPVFGYNLDALRQHYLDFGRSEGRSTDNFDEFRYIASYDDLTQYYGYNPAGGTEHYILYGYNEIQSGTRPQPSFDPAVYLATYTDLIQYVNQQFADPNTGAFINNYASILEFGNYHFITSGITENRSRTGFDPNSYLNRYSDLQAAFGNDLAAATRHYIEFGFEEGRMWM